MAGEVSAQGLYPAEHRGLRELHATASALVRHWERLSERLDGAAAAALSTGAGEARVLLSELAERGAAHDVHGVPAAQGAGGNIAVLRRAGDRFLERNQALRTALLDVQHVVTLLEWLAALAEQRADAGWVAFHRGWAERLGTAGAAVRDAALALAADPDAAIEPADQSALGRLAQKVAVSLGTAGEAIDSSSLGRAARNRGRDRD